MLKLKDTEFCKWERGEHEWLDLVQSVIGLGAEDEPVGRRAAYLDLIAPMPPERIWDRNGMSKQSGCALVARGLLRCYGVEDSLLWKPYVCGKAVADIVKIGRAHGAWDGPDSIPEPGDIVLIGSTAPGFGGTEHVLTVQRIDEAGVLVSVDGGQTECGLQCILQRARQLRKVGSQTWLDKRRVQGVLRMSAITPVGDQICPVIRRAE